MIWYDQNGYSFLAKGSFMQLTPQTLSGHGLRLEPLSEPLLAEVTRLALSAPQIWTYIPYPMRDSSDVARTLALALALQERGEALPLVTRLEHTGEIVGGTSLRLVDRGLPSLEIGGTWIVPAWQRTRVNTAAKLLQLGHCFEQLGCARVELKTDIDNTRSRAAILRLGASQEGILRQHRRRADGSLSDSVLFSILPREWPALRERLSARLARG
jgi:RimJ/RimL family protein N-acetyltransferase